MPPSLSASSAKVRESSGTVRLSISSEPFLRPQPALAKTSGRKSLPPIEGSRQRAHRSLAVSAASSKARPS
eukprot:3263756-Pleurochrysis_carterae.AAC.1